MLFATITPVPMFTSIRHEDFAGRLSAFTDTSYDLSGIYFRDATVETNANMRYHDARTEILRHDVSLSLLCRKCAVAHVLRGRCPIDARPFFSFSLTVRRCWHASR